MKELRCKTFWAKIYIAGPLDIIEQILRKEMLNGLCVTVTPTKYIYTGGEETGVEIGLINYPRFSTEDFSEITGMAIDIGERIMIGCHQMSYTVMTLDETYYFSRKEEMGVR